ncbi:hypothetical protein FOV72_20075 [Gordonia rubripertincta]|uniref:hypothetical protein n=1 Tax=Gordonia rubripertincta TaxID=36822 RepID=UPI00117C24F1|nr:hypothetical protein [Gordonia rubripertincta]QMU21684.1 hypothetical protein H3V45_04010 [Gordonia rubripertincta]TSD93407.1 hypothetical protein FOV72_20075 [Gordonia rubripertincta]
MRSTPGLRRPLTMAARYRRTWAAALLAVVEILVAYQAIDGGLALADDRWQMPREWLHNTPFDTWTGPGLVLIAAIGVPHALAALAVVLLPVDSRIGILGGLLSGASLVVWIGIQIALLQIFFFLQPVIVAFGIIEICLAILWRRALTRRPAPPPGDTYPTRPLSAAANRNRQ